MVIGRSMVDETFSNVIFPLVLHSSKRQKREGTDTDLLHILRAEININISNLSCA